MKFSYISSTNPHNNSGRRPHHHLHLKDKCIEFYVRRIHGSCWSHHCFVSLHCTQISYSLGQSSAVLFLLPRSISSSTAIILMMPLLLSVYTKSHTIVMEMVYTARNLINWFFLYNTAKLRRRYKFPIYPLSPFLQPPPWTSPQSDCYIWWTYINYHIIITQSV